MHFKILKWFQDNNKLTDTTCDIHFIHLSLFHLTLLPLRSKLLPINSPAAANQPYLFPPLTCHVVVLHPCLRFLVVVFFSFAVVWIGNFNIKFQNCAWNGGGSDAIDFDTQTDNLSLRASSTLSLRWHWKRSSSFATDYGWWPICISFTVMAYCNCIILIV